MLCGIILYMYGCFAESGQTYKRTGWQARPAPKRLGKKGTFPRNSFSVCACVCASLSRMNREGGEVGFGVGETQDSGFRKRKACFSCTGREAKLARKASTEQASTLHTKREGATRPPATVLFGTSPAPAYLGLASLGAYWHAMESVLRYRRLDAYKLQLIRSGRGSLKPHLRVDKIMTKQNMKTKKKERKEETSDGLPEGQGCGYQNSTLEYFTELRTELKTQQFNRLRGRYSISHISYII